MTGNSYQISGIVFIIISGLMYTLERCANWIANGLSALGLAVHAGNGSLNPPWVGINNNIFVIIFIVIGVGMFFYGSQKKRN